ncbi:MAG TPA: hypothetical protein VMZ69_07035 [Saprospiraceae bacterium]|nr:hypothetical protein [Saprospiraceae bacterium]
MRIFIGHIIILFLLLSNVCYGQTEEPRYYHWNLGVSAGDILHHVFNSDNLNRSYAAFVLEYSGHKYSVQAGFRPGYNHADTQHENFIDSDISKDVSMSGHLALTRNIFSDARWLIKAGLRYEGGWSREDIIEDSGFDRVTTRRLQWNAGGGPILDFRFYVHPRISLGTDAGLIYSYGQSELQQLFTNFPEFDNTKDKVFERKLNVSEPMTIYLRFHL